MTFFVVLALIFSGAASAEYKNESEAGVVIATGNSRSQSLSFKQEVRYLWREKNTISFKASFLQSKNLGVLNAKRWDSSLRYDRKLSEKFSAFIGQGVESDRFAGFLQRFNSDVGPRYVIYREEKKWDWISELGYRFSRERRMNGDRLSKNQVRAYTEISHQWSATASTKFWIEYLPNFSKTEDWAINSELSISAAVSAYLSVRLAYLVKYDNQPAPGATQKRDSLYTTSLVAKF